ncbi:MAG: hypothetical protein K8I65_10465 [Thermoanaerobaculia bacterium]|jgi:uncharacterized membrane protein|nr:hypothetical protein [Thermoanaerobaculia bacterium]
MNAGCAALGVAAPGCGLVGGVFFDLPTFMMRGVGHLPAALLTWSLVASARR